MISYLRTGTIHNYHLLSLFGLTCESQGQKRVKKRYLQYKSGSEVLIEMFTSIFTSNKLTFSELERS